MLQPIQLVNEQDVCCLVDPAALDPEARSLGEQLAISRDLLTALAEPMRPDRSSHRDAAMVVPVIQCGPDINSGQRGYADINPTWTTRRPALKSGSAAMRK